MNLPEDLQNYEFGPREVKLYCPRYGTITGKFESRYEILGYLMVHGDAEEHFLDYGFSKQNSKLLHSFHKKRMSSSFSGTFFNRHCIQYESGSLQTPHLHIYFFLAKYYGLLVENINRHNRQDLLIF